MNTQPIPDQDAQLELRISAAYRMAVNAPTPDLSRAMFDIMANLVRQRSPAQVERMERAMGLKH